MPTKVRARSAAAAVAGKNGHSLISDEKFRQLYATLLKYSLLEERLHSGFADNAEGAHSQIAGAAGVTLNLEREDTVVLTPTFSDEACEGRAATSDGESSTRECGQRMWIDIQLLGGKCADARPLQP